MGLGKICSVVLGLLSLCAPGWGMAADELPTISTAGAQKSMEVFFSVGAVWFRLPGGELYYWGTPWGGGTAKSLMARTPTQFSPRTNWVSADTGNVRGLGILDDHSLVIWGHNDLTNPGARPLLRPVAYPLEHQWRQIAAGDGATAGIDLEGKLWTWGENHSGGLAEPKAPARETPRQPLPDTLWTDVRACVYGFAGLKRDGSVWVWGSFPGPTPILHAKPVLASKAKDWTDLMGVAPPLARNKAGDIWLLSIPGSTHEWEKARRMATNSAPGRFAVAGSRIWEIAPDGSLWVRPNPARPEGMRENFAPRRLNERRDWLRLWSHISSAAAIAADGTVWAWGTNLPEEPVFTIETQLKRLKFETQKKLGMPLTAFSYAGTKPVLNEPVPLFQLKVEGYSDFPTNAVFKGTPSLP